MEQNRERLGSRLGFILLSAGCAIGLGNVYRFPIITGAYGGAIFVVIYIAFLLLLGLPVMTAELSVGRASQRSIASSFDKLEKPGQKWHWMKYLGISGNYLLMMFYTTITGWMLMYLIKYVDGSILSASGTAELSAVFGGMISNPGRSVLATYAVIILCFGICSIGLQKGVERITKVMMVALFVLMVGLAAYSCTLPGAKEGLRFFLVPDFARMKSVGIVSTLVGAMNQAFFTLSVGMGSMAIFGSYIGKEQSLLGESVNVIVLDTFVAIVAGLIMFPACYTYGLEVNAGPSLLFDTMATVFNHMAGGRWWGSLFFLFMVFAALSTVLAVCENILAMVREMTGWKRPLGCLVCGAGVFILAITTALGYSVFHFQPFAEGTAWLDLWDFLVSNNILPLGSLVFALYCCNKFGWGWDNFLAEANAGKGWKGKAWLKPIFRYLVPVAIIFIYIYGMVTFGWK